MTRATSTDTFPVVLTRLRLFVLAVVAIPSALLAVRVITGQVEWYGWGWQMFS